jgi:hypothetical protein
MFLPFFPSGKTGISRLPGRNPSRPGPQNLENRKIFTPHSLIIIQRQRILSKDNICPLAAGTVVAGGAGFSAGGDVGYFQYIRLRQGALFDDFLDGVETAFIIPVNKIQDGNNGGRADNQSAEKQK